MPLLRQFYPSEPGARFYSYLNASTGSSFDARSAGTSPLNTPTINNTIVDIVTVINEICR